MLVPAMLVGAMLVPAMLIRAIFNQCVLMLDLSSCWVCARVRSDRVLNRFSARMRVEFGLRLECGLRKYLNAVRCARMRSDIRL